MLSREESWDVIDRVAASLGVGREARYKWRERGKVPGRWHLPILRKAAAQSLELDPEALFDFHAGARTTAVRRGQGVGMTPVQYSRGHHVRIEAGGRLTIPKGLLEELELAVGDPVVLAVEGGELRLRSQKRAIAELQALVRTYVPEGVSLADELIAERRLEAELE
jgi:bifunctional DNA-binding transcriptional regulator/antitoxin component of YhaV-PrlF toxin-antitoxin module